MPSEVEREHLVREFCRNTGATHQLAHQVLNRNKWNLPKSYKEVEQMCIHGNRQSMPPPPPNLYDEGIRRSPAPSRGGMEGGIGLAVSLDSRGVRSTDRNTVHYVSGEPGPYIQQMEGLKVNLPPVTAPAERVIPIQVEGRRTLYQPQSHTTVPTTAMSRVTLDEKVMPSQPGMVAPKMASGNKPPPVKTAVPTTTQSSHSHDSIPRLKRGFSSITENEMLVSAARSTVLQDIKEDNHSNMHQTFMLPELTVYPEAFREFLMKELIESSTLNSLESAGRLNWWTHHGLCQRLFPMATSGDGNCLLHAASLSMWGIHDRLLTLRNALHDTLTSSTFKFNLYRRWRWQQTQLNQQSGLVFSEEEWETEWENILRLASPSPRTAHDSGVNVNSCCDSAMTSSSSGSEPVVYESLEEFHVFVLAHVLQRPIIVVADTILRDANGDALAPIPFGGIYLPLECARIECYTSPLLLTYDAAHFSALVPMQHSSSTYESSVPLAIPVLDPALQLLPLHFCHDPGPKFDWSSMNDKDTSNIPSLEDRLNLIKDFMDIVQLAPDTTHINSAMASRQSSSGSEDGGTLNSGTKDKKKDGKQTTVAKQMGSFGKSVGKKLKTIGNNLAPSKTGGKGQDTQKGQYMALGDGLTHSTNVATALATTGSGEDADLVCCAKLSCEFEDTRDIFIKNYLKDSQRRFQQDQELKRQKEEDQRSRGTLPTMSPMSHRQMCRTPTCRNHALPNISFCDNCASQHQWEQEGTLDRSRSKAQAQPSGYNTFPGRHKANVGLPSSTTANDEIYKCGKSKFYTPSNPEPSPVPQSLQVLRQSDRQQSMSTGSMARNHPVPRPRSPSPDYDNVRSGKNANPKCATPGCDFYGSKETGNFCSGCYKKNSKQGQLTRAEKSTKL